MIDYFYGYCKSYIVEFMGQPKGYVGQDYPIRRIIYVNRREDVFGNLEQNYYNIAHLYIDGLGWDVNTNSYIIY